MSDARSAIFQELRSQFDGLLPPSVILDCVDHAVQHLLGSISAEALTEMAIRLATVRLEHRIRATDHTGGSEEHDGPSASFHCDPSTGTWISAPRDDRHHHWDDQ